MGNVPVSKLVGKGKENKLTKFQRQKLRYDFDTFFDLNNDGHLSFKDLLWAKDKICFMSGWKIGTDKYKETEALFKSIWATLEVIADIDQDGKITKDEWLLMWTEYKKEIIAQGKKGNTNFLKEFYLTNKSSNNALKHLAKDLKKNGEAKLDSSLESKSSLQPPISRDESLSVVLDSDEEAPPNFKPTKKEKGPPKKETVSKKAKGQSTNLDANKNIGGEQKDPLTSIAAQDTEEPDQECEESILPKWMTRYLQFRFDLLDRTADGVIDNEEFEYVLSEFGCSERYAKQAFTLVTKNKTVELDFDYFVQLFEQYYLSDDPSDLGNFINGKLDFNAMEDEDSGVDDEDPGAEDRRIDSNASLDSMDSDIKKKDEKPSKFQILKKRILMSECCTLL